MLCISEITLLARGIAQLVEHRSPKPGVVSSNLTAPAKLKYYMCTDSVDIFLCYLYGSCILLV